VSETAARLYARYAKGSLLEAERGPEHDELEALGLVVVEGGRPLVLDPQRALRRHAVRQLNLMQKQAEQLAAVPAVAEALSAHFQRARAAAGGCEFLADKDLVNARIQDVVGAAKAEIMAAQPGGPRNRDHMQEAAERDADALRRGVTLRTMYRDSVRQHPVTREWAQVMSAQGAQYRTLVSPFERCIVVDGRVAFISDLVVGAEPHAAWQVTHPAAVAFITAVFEDAWRRAEPWQGWLRNVVEPDGVRTTRIQREILRDTVAGIKQTVTAARLGMGVRSLQRQLDQIRDMWGVETLAELGYHFALSPDRLVDDQAVDTVTGAATAEESAA
jgi:hypothetical protein